MEIKRVFGKYVNNCDNDDDPVKKRIKNRKAISMEKWAAGGRSRRDIPQRLIFFCKSETLPRKNPSN